MFYWVINTPLKLNITAPGKRHSRCSGALLALNIFPTLVFMHISHISHKWAYRNSWTLDARVGRWTLDTGLWKLDSERWTLDAGLWTLEFERWTLDAGLGRWTLDSGSWFLDAGLWTLDTGLWTLDVGL